jgi:DNA-binding beta-propeller fold protein YncE
VSGDRRRRRGTSAGRVLAITALGLSGACSLHQEGVHPPDNRIFFPGGAIVDRGGRWLYVVNSNSDLRYNSGTVVAVDLNLVRADDPRDPMGSGRSWSTCPADSRFVPNVNVSDDQRCCWDFLDPTILSCDEQKYIQENATVRIGSFAGRPVIQQLPQNGGQRMFIPVRGDTSITMIELGTDPGRAQLLCTGPRTEPNQAPPRLAACEEDWRITQPRNQSRLDSDLSDDQLQRLRLQDEPYALAVDDVLGLLYVGHLRGGGVSLIVLGDRNDPGAPNLTGPTYLGLLPPDVNGSQGVTSLTIKAKGCTGAIYAASRFNPVVSSFVVYGLEDCGVAADPARNLAIVGTGQVLSTGLPGSETRGFEFAAKKSPESAACLPGAVPDPDCTPDRAFILQRTPPALVAIDMATLAPFAVMEVCQSPTNLEQQRDSDGRTVALYVTCFDAGEIYIVDPWVPRVRTIIPVGRGPIATVFPPQEALVNGGPARAYVVGFGANNIAVVDLDPQSPTRDRVIQRIGFSSATPREVANQ